jgi:hypothetical protein
MTHRDTTERKTPRVRLWTPWGPETGDRLSPFARRQAAMQRLKRMKDAAGKRGRKLPAKSH